MRSERTITTNSSPDVCIIKGGNAEWIGTIGVQGNGGANFGGGTVTMQISFDGGITKINMLDDAGLPQTFTANGAKRIGALGRPHGGAQTIIYATLTGATSPNIRVFVDDNS